VASRRVLVLATLAALVLGFLAGKGARGLVRANSEVHSPGAMNAQVTELRSGLEAARQELANAQAGLEIERRASAGVREDLAQAQLRIGQLEQEAELYRSLLDSSIRRSGLSLHTLQVLAADGDGSFRFRIVLVQKARNFVDIAGSLRLSLNGREAGAKRVLAYPEIGIPRGVHALPVRLRYFQVIEGRLEIPSGFEPETVLVEVDIVEGGRQRLRERRDWQV